MRIKTLAVAATTVTVTVLGGWTVPTSAEPPVNTDGSGHVHHVWLGNGSCLQIDAVTWDATTTGMHRGANMSGVDHGPWHGPCSAM